MNILQSITPHAALATLLCTATAHNMHSGEPETKLHMAKTTRASRISRLRRLMPPQLPSAQQASSRKTPTIVLCKLGTEYHDGMSRVTITKKSRPFDSHSQWTWNDRNTPLSIVQRLCNFAQSQDAVPPSNTVERAWIYVHNNTPLGVCVTGDNEVILHSEILKSESLKDDNRRYVKSTYLDGYRPHELFCTTNEDISHIITRDRFESTIGIYAIARDKHGAVRTTKTLWATENVDNEILPLYCRNKTLIALGLEHEQLYYIDLQGRKPRISQAINLCERGEHIRHVELAYAQLGMNAVLSTTREALRGRLRRIEPQHPEGLDLAYLFRTTDPEESREAPDTEPES